MIHETSAIAVLVFLAFAGAVLGISFHLGSRAKSASGYFAAGGGIHWAVNGIAFAPPACAQTAWQVVHLVDLRAVAVHLGVTARRKPCHAPADDEDRFIVHIALPKKLSIACSSSYRG